MEEKIVHLKKKFSYGNCHLHPANEQARNFCFLTGRKTILQSDFKYIKKLDFAIMVNGNYV